jgi:sugar lactone lactonase YvrE
MRKLSAIALVSCMTLGATAAMAAQTTPSTSMDKPATSGSMAKTTKAAKTTTTTTTTHPTKGSHASGAITAMDATAKTITVGSGTYTLTDATKITSHGKTMMMTDLHVGDTVSLSYAKTGDAMNATRVVVTKAAKM